jgi:hypothetical protein
MSEKMYARLLRIYPSTFRKKYEGEALQLIRDRFHHETGLKRLRLWRDLATDLLAGLPQAYRNSYAVKEAMSLSPSGDGIPSFKVLDNEPLRRGSILVGCAGSLTAIAAFGFVLSHPIAYLPMSGSNGRMSPIESVFERLNRATTSDTVVSDAQGASKPASASTREQQSRPWPAAAASASKPETQASPPESKSSLGEQNHVVRVQAQVPKGHFSSLMRASQPVIDGAERQQVINGAIANLKQHYFDRDVAQRTADALVVHEKRGDDDAAKDGAAFAGLLTRQMREASQDMHLVIEFSERTLPVGPPVQTADGMERFRNAMLQQNCMIRKAEILPHDIGYLKLDFFPDTSVCGSAMKAAMASLNRANVIIFDLRDNTGGFPDSVSLIASYLFDHRTSRSSSRLQRLPSASGSRRNRSDRRLSPYPGLPAESHPRSRYRQTPWHCYWGR